MAEPTPAWQEPAAGGAKRGGWQLADHLGDVISAHAPDGTYRYASAAAHRLLGYEPAELVGTGAFEYFHPEDADKVATAFRSAFAGLPFVVTYRLRRKDGVYIWVETTTSIVTDADEGDVVTELVACTRAIDAREVGIELGDSDPAPELEKIERVLASGEIVPVFQPIFELETMNVVALEALARFPGDPAHTPDRWFADAWRVGLGIPLELHAAKLATAEFARLGAKLTLFVNASPPVVAAPGFLQSIGAAGAQVTVEVTEHLKIDDYHQLGLELAAFRAAGGQLAIDDFGAGFASFRHIQELRPQWIKLDGALIHQLETSEFARGLAHAVVSFAHGSGVEVIAEGIETETELEQVRALGIRHGQGFLLGRPLSLEEALTVSGS